MGNGSNSFVNGDKPSGMVLLCRDSGGGCCKEKMDGGINRENLNIAVFVTKNLNIYLGAKESLNTCA